MTPPAFAARACAPALAALLLLPLAWLGRAHGPWSWIVAGELVLLVLWTTELLRRRDEELRTGHRDAVRTMMDAIDAGDPFTQGHSDRIAAMSLAVGRRLGLSSARLEELEYAALLHDYGRTAIRREILGKQGRLSREEHNELRDHPRVAADFIRAAGFYPGAAEIVLAHHEQPDGRGYPRGLRGDEIPPGSRIIMAAAAFDAMTSDRPYRRGLPAESAFEELLAFSGTQFFPEVVEALIDLYAEGSLRDPRATYDVDAGGSAEDAAPARSGRGSEPPGGRRPAPDARRGSSPAEPRVLCLEEDAAESRLEREESFALPDGRAVAVAAASDVGCVRRNNEDAFTVVDGRARSRGVLAAVADGMGGAAAGEIASHVAVTVLEAAFVDGEDDRDIHALLRDAMGSANESVLAETEGNATLTGMGTTCTAAVVHDGELYLAHVGDSRAYLVRGGSIECLTRDHTLATELQRYATDGLAMEGHHILTRCLGAEHAVEADVLPAPLPLEPGDVVLLCSDGLTNVLEDAEIAALAARRSPSAYCRALVEAARERGAPDNVTAVVIAFERDAA